MLTVTGKNDSEKYIDHDRFKITHSVRTRLTNVSFHTHDFFEIILYLNGEVHFYIEETEYYLNEGDILIIPPGKMHRTVVANNNYTYERIILWVSSNFIHEQLSDCGTCLFHDNTNSMLLSLNKPKFKELLYFTDYLIKTPKDSANYESLSSGFLSLLLKLMNQHLLTVAIDHSKSSSNELVIQKIITYINDHLAQELSLDLLAETFFLSKFHMNRKFKEYTYFTIHSYIINKRIVLAKKLMKEGMNAKEAAISSGFTTYANFYKAFISITEITPSDYIKSIHST